MTKLGLNDVLKLGLNFMIELIQRVARMFFRAFVVGAIIMMWNPKAIWGLPFGIIIGLCSEAEALTKK